MSYSLTKKITKGQLFDPFYGAVTPDVARALTQRFPSFPNPAASPDAVHDAYTLDQLVAREVNLPRRQAFYESNRKNLGALLRRRAYENAFFEFKKGVYEEGENMGPSISESVGNRVSYQEVAKAGVCAWCACFIAWCYHYAGWASLIGGTAGLASAATWGKEGLMKEISVPPDPIISGPNPNKMARLKVVSNVETLEPGDTVVFNVGDHVGMFSKWIIRPSQNNGLGLFSTIEGNTGPDHEVTFDGRKFTAISSGGQEGVYAKKHEYDIKTGRDSIGDRTVSFGRIVI